MAIRLRWAVRRKELSKCLSLLEVANMLPIDATTGAPPANCPEAGEREVQSEAATVERQSVCVSAADVPEVPSVIGEPSAVTAGLQKPAQSVDAVGSPPPL